MTILDSKFTLTQLITNNHNYKHDKTTHQQKDIALTCGIALIPQLLELMACKSDRMIYFT